MPARLATDVNADAPIAKAPRKPRAPKVADVQIPTMVDGPEPEEIFHDCTDVIVAPPTKAPRKPRAPKVVAPKPEPEPVVVAPEPVVVADVPKILPPHQIEEPIKANPTVKKERKKRVIKVDADGYAIQRPPTEYILFITKTLHELKEQYMTYVVKPTQKEIMIEAAAKWRTHKEILAGAAK